QIDNSLEIANNLLLDLNEIARIESGNITPVVRAISVEQLFDMLSLEFKPLTKQYGIDFKYQYSALYIKSDLTLLTRIIQNFLSNAVRYTHSGKVLLGCRRQGKHLCIQVYDTGPGIPKEQQQQVFEQFTQLGTKTTGPKGLGLGLNIAQSLACLLNHSIDLKSTIGKGSMFSVAVPIAPKQQRGPAPMPIAVTTLQGVKVLCIDNEENILSGMQDLLTAWKCEVYTAQSAELALEIFAQHDNQFDFLLVDYQLQDNALFNAQTSVPATQYQRDGISLIELLQAKSQYPIPAILITATTDEHVVTRAQLAGIGYLRKIVKPITLRALMSSLLAKNLEKNYAHQDFI
ncbi:MAG: hybrid sensor histidine kinase/response regulator, partial [Oceanospirillaceae bacterium]